MLALHHPGHVSVAASLTAHWQLLELFVSEQRVSHESRLSEL